MLVIRLKRTGRINDPSYKIVVGEKQYSPKSGKHFAYLGSYNPKTKAAVIDEEAVKGWLQKGAQASATVHNLLVSKGIVQGKKINVLPTYKAPEVEAPKEEPKAAPAPEGDGASTESVGEEAAS